MWDLLPISDKRAHKRVITFLCNLGRNNEGFKSNTWLSSLKKKQHKEWRKD